MNLSEIDYSKIKKSPVPKGDTTTKLYLRGSGIKVKVSEGGIVVYNSDDVVLTERHGDYADKSTGEIKNLVRAMLNRVQQLQDQTGLAVEDYPSLEGSFEIEGVYPREEPVATGTLAFESDEAKDRALAPLDEATLPAAREALSAIEGAPEHIIDDAQHAREQYGDDLVDSFLRSPRAAAAAAPEVPTTRNRIFALLSGKLGRA